MITRNRTRTILTLAAVAVAILAASAQAATTTIIGTAGGDDSWNTAANWDAGVPSGAVDAIVSDGILAQVNNVATPTYSGSLTLNSNSSLRILKAGGSHNAVEGASGITMNEGSKIQVNINANINFPPIALAGNASIESLYGASDHETDNFSAITGAHTLTISGFNNHTYNLNAANSFSELICDAIDRWNLRAKAAGALGAGNVTINPRTNDGRSATLYIDAPNAMAITASLFLNGGGYSGAGSDRMVMNADLTVRELWIDGVQQPSGTYTSAEGFISAGSGTLTVLENPGAGSEVVLVTTSPKDNAVDVLVPSQLVATFSKTIALGTGDITIRNLTDWIDIVIPVGDARISVSGPLLTIDPGSDLDWSKDYTVRIDPTAIDSVSGISFAGISDETMWNFATAPGDPLFLAIAELKDHINGVITLSAAQIETHKLTIDAEKSRFAESAAAITAVFDLVETYDTVIGPLWIARGQFTRSAVLNDIDWTLYNVMQYIMDWTYTENNILLYEDLFDGFRFESSANFPGAVNPPADPDETHTVTINGSYLKTFGRMTMHADRPARKPTGTYLAPGSIATITVPPSMVGKGYEIRVGAHSWDFSNRPKIKRLDRSSLVYSIDSSEVKVASPLGGGIYIEVPYLADAGIVDVQIKNAVRSPFFSAKSFHSTSLLEWQNIERKHPAPWADFQSDKFMMQVPTSWIYNFDDPAALMANWDDAMDAMNDLMGFPHIRGKEAMYPQVDVLFRASVYAPGYPSVNVKYDPTRDYGGNYGHHLLKGPQHAPDYLFHEEGHGYLFVKFSGETESTVNLLHVAVWHQKFGYDLDTAFRKSRGFNNTYRTLDNTAVAWMTVFNFSPNKQPMASGEKAYQLKGHAKFVDMARLFGWEGLNAFWHSINADFENGITWSKHDSDIDDLILRWCQSVGVDLRPLFHFWGTHPVNTEALGAAIEAENLPASAEIYDTLVRYKSLVPIDNSAFQDFAFSWWGKQPSINGYWTEREHARQWDDEVLWDPQVAPNGEMFDESSCTRIKEVIDELIELYFPGGRPSVDAGVSMITWSGQSVQLDPNVAGTPLTYAWSADPVDGVGVAFSDATALAPTVTITKPAPGDAVTVTLALTVKGGLNPVMGDTMTIDVYDDACLAAIGKGLGADNPTDFDGNCITGLEDVAVMATKWLIHTGLTGPVPK